MGIGKILEWTSAPPNENGFYFIKENDDVSVIKVVDYYWYSRISLKMSDTSNLMFAGPIPLPKEPER